MSSGPGIDEFAEQTAATLAAAGFPRMAARVMMMLMTEESGSATADELAERLGASAAAISGAVRYLQSLSIIRRHTVPGTRRHRYELPEHVWYATSSSQTPLYTHLIALAEKGAAALPPESKARDRAVEMADYFRFMRERLPQLLEEWQATRA
ncbi:MarR family transcriptional regulator [Glaciihabitans sp. INWT7]|uniref:GbsR/MarR family transcriptional regulator n=1 Tax=Glaciihabitans sp. INWT7 TaxID=2596912 RepID=UPI0016248EBB|nr:MarR family transcriptional regulator [Glaciihabitans sp. INWT7]QNE45540.1 MarR family transcriptional regulator [Glaciihabitans sp. INWT7]